jgi:hypothetical protein
MAGETPASSSFDSKRTYPGSAFNLTAGSRIERRAIGLISLTISALQKAMRQPSASTTSLVA